MSNITLESILGDNSNSPDINTTRLYGEAPDNKLPISEEQLLNEPSGNLFGMTQSVAMGMAAEDANKDQFLLLSTQGGLRAEDGTALALGYHTGHWEIGLLVKAAAETFRNNGAVPFSATVSDLSLIHI